MGNSVRVESLENWGDTKDVFYFRPGGDARISFRYPKDKRGFVEIVALTNKNNENKIIKYLIEKFN
jgi:hypothetical protein